MRIYSKWKCVLYLQSLQAALTKRKHQSESVPSRPIVGWESERNPFMLWFIEFPTLLRYHTILLLFWCAKDIIVCSCGSRISRWGGADPLGGANLRCVCFSAKMYVKTKELDPVGRGARRRHPPWIRHCYLYLMPPYGNVVVLGLPQGISCDLIIKVH